MTYRRICTDDVSTLAILSRSRCLWSFRCGSWREKSRSAIPVTRHSYNGPGTVCSRWPITLMTSTANLPFQPVGCPPWQSKVELDKIFPFALSHALEVYTTDHTFRRQSTTRAKLAYDVAKSVKRFLEVRCCPTETSTLASEVITLEGEGKGSRR